MDLATRLDARAATYRRPRPIARAFRIRIHGHAIVLAIVLHRSWHDDDGRYHAASCRRSGSIMKPARLRIRKDTQVLFCPT